MELKDVVDKLVGYIHPVGETYTDDERFENLKVLCDLVDRLTDRIKSVARHKTRSEYSMSRAGEYAEDFLKNTLGIKE